MSIIIRETTLEEAAGIHNRVPEFERRELAYFYERTANKEKLVIVAYADDRPVGYLVGYDSDGDFYCWLAGVLPEFRKNGILKSMMGYMYYWAKLRGYGKIKIKTRNKRREMLSYLVSNGFSFVKISRRVDPEENRILLERLLN